MRDSGTRYARRGDASLAYRMLGEGPVDLVYLTGIVSHVEAVTDEPGTGSPQPTTEPFLVASK